MFLHSRFVVVDDKAEHLRGIKETLDALRYDCHTKLYDEEAVGDWASLPGLRILFVDKNLRTGVTMGGGQQSAFAAIVEVVEKLISEESGPYGLILWAEEPEFEEFKQFLFERLSKDKSALLPVFCEQLKKGDYINTVDGSVLNPDKLRDDILAKMTASPQMKALFSWEADVSVALDAVLKSIVDLVPADKRGTEDFGTELGKVLYRLSQAGAGIERAEENPRESINRVLVPILSDRITEHDPAESNEDQWKTALVAPTSSADKNAPVNVQAAVHSAIHLSQAKNSGSASINASDLGAVIQFPHKDAEKALHEVFGITKAEIQNDNFFGMTDQDWSNSELRLVQIGAACDHAQPKPGPLLYLLGVEWPFAQQDGTKSEGSKLYWKKSKKRGELEWRSPILAFGLEKKPGILSVFLNCSFSAPLSQVKDWRPVYRLRDELVSELTQHYARFISRPGIVRL